jgi:hypothetical protein
MGKFAHRDIASFIMRANAGMTGDIACSDNFFLAFGLAKNNLLNVR